MASRSVVRNAILALLLSTGSLLPFSATSAEIPLEFRGAWASIENCTAHSDGKGIVFIDARYINGYEWGCKIVKATRSKQHVFQGDFLCEGYGTNNSHPTIALRVKKQRLSIDSGEYVPKCK